MSYKLSWLVENRILLCYQWGTFSKTDFWLLLEDIRATVNASSSTVHIIIDARDLKHFEIQCEDLQGFLSMQVENGGWMVILGSQHAAKLIGSVARNLLNLRSLTANSTEQARSFLLEIDSTLPNF